MQIGKFYLIKNSYLVTQLIAVYSIDGSDWRMLFTSPGTSLAATQMKVLDVEIIDNMTSIDLCNSLRRINNRFFYIILEDGDFAGVQDIIHFLDLDNKLPEYLNKIIFPSLSFDDYYTYEASKHLTGPQRLWRTGVKMLNGKVFDLIPHQMDKYPWGITIRTSIIRILKTQKLYGE